MAIEDGKIRLEWPIDGMIEFMKSEQALFVLRSLDLTGATRARMEGIAEGIGLCLSALAARVAAEQVPAEIPPGTGGVTGR